MAFQPIYAAPLAPGQVSSSDNITSAMFNHLLFGTLSIRYHDTSHKVAL
jgi:hypothetical protein